MKLGDNVSYHETFRGIRWTKVGEVVEIGYGPKEGRVRVKWSHWEYPSGHNKPDGKRTWMSAKRLTLRTPEDTQ